MDDASDEYPIYLTTGRVVSQFLSGTQTRRIGPLVKQYAEPRIEMHPRLAAKLGIADGDWSTAETRRGTITLKAQVVTTIRPDTIFIPYHWAGRKSANQLTVAAQDPISKIPQYKVCGCRLRKADGAAGLRGGPRAPAIDGQDHMAKPDYLHFFIDPNRCIGCQACVQACTECDTHRGESMIHLEYVNRAESVQTVPVVCMHCEQPTCAEVCPADAIKRTGDGVVQSARKPRCIACGNCVVACPFGVPEVYEDRKIMMKCDMCYDRTSVGKKPMCATVCPSQALFFGTREQIEQLRPLSTPINTFQFGRQTITTLVHVMVPRALTSAAAYVDVTAAMDEQPRSRAVSLKVVSGGGGRERSLRRGGGVAMSDARFDPRRSIDPAINSPGREGLTGTAPASLYSPALEREQITVAPNFAPADAQPAWRQDFPIDWPQDLYVERRDFMKFLVLTSAAFTLGQVSIAVQNWYRKRSGQPPMQRIASVDAIAVGGAVSFTYPDEHEPCLLVRLTTSEFVAFNQKCTHLSCAVIPRPTEGSFYCPCHEGRFDLRTGAPTAGPPRRPLTRIVLDIRGRDIYAVAVEERTT